MNRPGIYIITAQLISFHKIKNLIPADKFNCIPVCSNNLITALTDIKNKCPEILILDDTLFENEELLQFYKRINTLTQKPNIILLTDSKEPKYFVEGLNNGIKVILNKCCQEKHLLEAIKLARFGGHYFDISIKETLFWNNLSHSCQKEIANKILNRREIEIFNLICTGLENKAISRTLNITEKTISNYKQNIKEKLNLKSIKDIYDLSF
jgi:DNA-binding NarL/FixJ family response regulator